MDENRIVQLMNQFDNDLMTHELDELMDSIDINMTAISKKAHWKLWKGQKGRMNRRKRILAIIAASLVAICGVASAYASEISSFIQSLMNKTEVYGTVVEGATYYLAEPMVLDHGNRLNQAMFDQKELQIQLQMADGSLPSAKIRIDGQEMEPKGMEGQNLFFYDVEPRSQFDLILDEKTYPVQLIASQSVLKDGIIVETKPKNIEWISMGYRKFTNGIQILTTFDDDSIKLVFLQVPASDLVTQTFQQNGNNIIYGSNRESLQPLTGTALDGQTYTFTADKNEIGRPLTKFITEAKIDGEIALRIPGIVVSKEVQRTVHISLPQVGEKVETAQTIDFGLQKMELQSITRTSETTVTLIFAMNTGDDKDVRIWEADAVGMNAKSGDILWKDGICTMNMTFDKAITEMDILIGDAYFIVDGNWILQII